MRYTDDTEWVIVPPECTGKELTLYTSNKHALARRSGYRDDEQEQVCSVEEQEQSCTGKDLVLYKASTPGYDDILSWLNGFADKMKHGLINKEKKVEIIQCDLLKLGI